MIGTTNQHVMAKHAKTFTMAHQGTSKGETMKAIWLQSNVKSDIPRPEREKDQLDGRKHEEKEKDRYRTQRQRAG
jgi:hypothetical protein